MYKNIFWCANLISWTGWCFPSSPLQAAGFGVPIPQSPLSILNDSLATLGTKRIAFFPPPLNLPLFGALSETISIIELSIWQFIYDKGVITQ